LIKLNLNNKMSSSSYFADSSSYNKNKLKKPETQLSMEIPMDVESVISPDLLEDTNNINSSFYNVSNLEASQVNLNFFFNYP
jgi:hypothetical protein